jgi:hypothetical protein
MDKANSIADKTSIGSPKGIGIIILLAADTAEPLQH